jgi:hypothetical protein
MIQTVSQKINEFSLKYRKLLLAGMLVFLIIWFGYQVAFGTNESSYRMGFTQAATDWGCLGTPSDKPGEDCGYGYFNPTDDVCYASNPHVDNVTACDDGYIAGYVHWCSSDQKDCVNLVKHVGFPEIVQTLKLKASEIAH